MSAPTTFRTPAEDAPTKCEPKRGPIKACPMCGAATGKVCEQCGGPPSDRYPSLCEDFGSKCRGYIRDGAFTSAAHYCGPNQRLRIGPRVWGFLWRRLCAEPGPHLHQSCRCCGWRGVFLPASEVAS